MTNPNTGRFNWHELMTTDPTAAVRFYAEVLGWSVQEVDMGPMGVYRLLKSAGKDVGGCMAAPPGMPSAWLTYVGSDDVDATAKKIVEHGGKILHPATDVPGMVRFAIATDPQGAAIGVLKGLGPNANDPPPAGPPALGTFVWDELHTTDQDAAGKFYHAIFGWTGKVGDGDPMKYWHWAHDDKDIGGMMTLQTPHAPPHWLAYVAVSDVDASTAKVVEHGGKVLMPAMDIPKVGKFSVVQDPTGAAFSLFRSARV
jgi:predicted enzyme related to lactoylglutathione lyase